MALAASMLAFAACAGPAVDVEAAGAEPGNPDRENFGERGEILFWTPEQQVAGYRNIDQIGETRWIGASDDPYPLGLAPQDLSSVTYEVEGEQYTVEDYIRDRRIAGLLVVKDDAVVFERYGLGNDENSRWISFSIAKSVVSMLYGAAIVDGYIAGVDEPVTKYLPLLSGGGYDGVTIQHVLRMASGVDWNEDYADPESDVATLPSPVVQQARYMAGLERLHPAGEVFHYNTGETNMAGAVLRAAIGNNLSTYLEHKIWGPFGMEADANWVLHEPAGGELGGCCISATLRDYARIGIFAMNGGVLRDGSRVLPEGWMADSTSPSPGYDGYGYLWWLSDDGVFAGIGIFGQYLWMDPSSNTVIVTHSAWPYATNREYSQHRAAMVSALANAVR
jgi:CubicO group peptidase (beta-lactamase class C family)